MRHGATWYPPCMEEIEILLKEKPVDFPVLADSDGLTAE